MLGSNHCLYFDEKQVSTLFPCTAFHISQEPQTRTKFSSLERSNDDSVHICNKNESRAVFKFSSYVARVEKATISFHDRIAE